MKNGSVDNSIYDHYEDRWYTAFDDPVALLRAESVVKTKWTIQKIETKFKNLTEVSLLDVGCGGGFLSNALAKTAMQITAVDLSETSLAAAARHDETGRVTYISCRFTICYSCLYDFLDAFLGSFNTSRLAHYQNILRHGLTVRNVDLYFERHLNLFDFCALGAYDIVVHGWVDVHLDVHLTWVSDIRVIVRCQLGNDVLRLLHFLFVTSN